MKTCAVFICDDNWFNSCEISSAILDERITLATNNVLSNYYSKDDLAKFGLIEADRPDTNKFELSMDDRNHMRFKYLGSANMEFGQLTLYNVWNSSITIETVEFITTQELISKFERFAYQLISVQFVNKMTSK